MVSFGEFINKLEFVNVAETIEQKRKRVAAHRRERLGDHVYPECGWFGVAITSWEGCCTHGGTYYKYRCIKRTCGHEWEREHQSVPGRQEQTGVW
jgi:hypothetical protein